MQNNTTLLWLALHQSKTGLHGENLSGGGRLIMIYDVTINKNVYSIRYKWHLFGVAFVREDEPKKTGVQEIWLHIQTTMKFHH